MSTEFEVYLASVRVAYEERSSFYTQTDLCLMVQTVEEKTRGESDQVKERETIEQLPVLEGLQKYASKHVLLVGRPGSGKSTALEQLLLELARRAQEDAALPIPVLVQLKADRQLLLSIRAELWKHGLNLTDEDIRILLFEGKLLLLLDGVNEIPKDSLRHDLQQFREENPKVSMIFTTRDLELGGTLGIKKKLKMQPLTPDQLREFVWKSLGEQGEALLSQLNDRLKELAETPMFLKMLCDVFKLQGDLPRSRGELFRTFDQKYEEIKGHPTVSADSRRFKPELLQHLAFGMLKGDALEPQLTLSRLEAEQRLEKFLTGRVSNAGQKAKEWLEDLLEHHLLQETGDWKRIEFPHQLFLEYQAAEALLNRVDRLEDNQLKREFLNYLKWTEPLAMMLALVRDEAQAVRVVRLALEVDFKLGAQLAGEPTLAFQKKTVNLIDDLKISDFLKVQLLDISRSEHTLRFLHEKLRSQDITVREKTAITLGKTGTEPTINLLIGSLNHQDSEIRRMAAYGLGEVSSERVRFELINKLERDEDPEVRWKAAYSLGKIAHESDMDALHRAFQRDRDPRVRTKAALAWGMVKSKSATASLIQFSSSDLDSLRQLLSSDTDDTARKFAAEAFGEIGGESAVDALFDALSKDSDGWVRDCAANSLGKIGGELAIDALIRALRCNTNKLKSLQNLRDRLSQELNSEGSYSDKDNREANNLYQSIISLIKALGKNHENASATNELLDFLYEYFDSYFRIFYESYFGSFKENILKVLKQIRYSSIIDLLNRNLYKGHDDKLLERLKISAEALGEIGNEQCMLHLAKAFNEGDEPTDLIAGRALAKIEHETVIKIFREACLNERTSCRKFWIATNGLGEIGSESAIEHLFNISNLRFRSSDESTLDTLLDALESHEPWTRWSAAYNILKRNFRSLSPEVFQDIEVRFFNCFNDEEENHIWKSYAYLLSEIESESIVSRFSLFLEEDLLDEVPEWYLLRIVDTLGKIDTQDSINVLGCFLVGLSDKFSEVSRRNFIVAKILRIFRKTVNLPVQCYLIESLENEKDLDSQTSTSIVEVLADIGDSKAVSSLWGLLSKHSKDAGIIYIAISTIQDRYKYYNYEIYQAYLNAQNVDRQTQNIDSSQTTIHNFPNATEVKIFENVDQYYEAPPKDPPS